MKLGEFTIKRLGAFAIALWAARVFLVDSRRVRRCASSPPLPDSLPSACALRLPTGLLSKVQRINTGHGNFDNDLATIAETLVDSAGSQLTSPVDYLRGF